MKKKTQSIAEQFEQYVDLMISRCGKGHVASRKEIVDDISAQYGTKPYSILPSDYCYNRWNKGMENGNYPLLFEYLDNAEYRFLGRNHPFTGLIKAKPKGEQEKIVGEWIDGKRYFGRPAVYPDDLLDESPEYREGKKNTVKVNQYERNSAARRECIAHYGSKCTICGLDFAQLYGPQCDGLIHVHHLKKISDTCGEYNVDPISDLRPVCPNCHMVLHSIPDMYTIEEVAQMLGKRGC